MGSQWVSVMLGILSGVTESRGAENADYFMCPNLNEKAQCDFSMFRKHMDIQA